jgi:hypothetical protein
MSAASTAAAPTNQPDPSRDRPAAGADAPSRAVRLLGLVRKLIDYGKELANTLQQRTTATNLANVTLGFGTIDIALILSLITRGLHRAAALEARLVGRAGREAAAGPAAANAPSRRKPRAAQPAARSADGAESRVARLPTPGDIAAQVRRRPIGAVIADICREFGILPSDPLWRELSDAIVENGGNLATLYIDINKRLWSPKAAPPPITASVAAPAEPESCPPSSVAFGTGPP